MCKQLNDIVSCSITYQPDDVQLQSTIAQMVASGFVPAIYDNSDTPDARARVRHSCERAGVDYLCGGSNIGTAGGLNALCKFAADRGAQVLHYLDQDSIASPSYLDALERSVNLLMTSTSVAIVGASVRSTSPPGEAGEGPVVASAIIASGMAMRVEVVQKLGGFDQELFLDLVDFDLCFRLRRAGYLVLRDPSRVLDHEVGTSARFLSKRLGWSLTTHPLWRRELMWRNSVIFVRRHWRSFPTACAKHMIVRLVDTLIIGLRTADFNQLLAAGRGIISGTRGTPFVPPRPS